MNIQFKPSALKISPKLLNTIKRAIIENDLTEEVLNITVNFRDCSYNCEAGGYHPVEIALQKEQESDRWSLLYITDFSYYGHPYAELIKDLDFDFSAETFFAVYCPPRPITHRSVREIFQLWQYNFLSYLEFGAFDEIKVSAW